MPSLATAAALSPTAVLRALTANRQLPATTLTFAPTVDIAGVLHVPDCSTAGFTVESPAPVAVALCGNCLAEHTPAGDATLAAMLGAVVTGCRDRLRHTSDASLTDLATVGALSDRAVAPLIERTAAHAAAAELRGRDLSASRWRIHLVEAWQAAVATRTEPLVVAVIRAGLDGQLAGVDDPLGHPPGGRVITPADRVMLREVQPQVELAARAAARGPASWELVRPTAYRRARLWAEMAVYPSCVSPSGSLSAILRPWSAAKLSTPGTDTDHLGVGPATQAELALALVDDGATPAEAWRTAGLLRR